MEANKASRLKSQFLVRMSQEMQAPVDLILGYCKRLSSPDTSNEQRKLLARSIQNNSKYLSCLIGNILNVAEIESNTIQANLVKCSPHEVLEEVAAIMSQFTAEKNLFLKVEHENVLPPHIYSDPQRIAQMLITLISNAIKHTHKGGITIVVSKADHGDPPTALSFRVIDTGIGIQKDVSAKLFQAFVEEESQDTETQKVVGYDLSLVKSLARLLGGKITHYSDPGAGSTFVVTIATHLDEPFVKLVAEIPNPPTTSIIPPHIVHPLLDQKRILFVEDDEDTRKLIAFYLKNEGAVVDEATNGRIALEKGIALLKKNVPYDIILMDIEMPEMTGIEATQKLRASGYHAPILAFTAFGSKEEVDKCLASGCDEVLIKPVPYDALIRKIAAYCIPTDL